MRIFNQDISVLGDLTLNTSNSYGNFLTIDGTGIVRYRTPAEVLGDIGAIEEAPNDGQEWVRKNEGWVLNTGASSGETNTASSQGTGESLYYQKVGSDLQFYSIKSENNLLTVSLDSSTNDIELTVNQANISITESQISDLQAYVLPGANISIFNNDSGYITDYTVTEGDVTAHEAALSLTISQLSDFPTNVSHFTNDAGYITSFTNNYVSGVSFSTATGDLTFTRNGLADIVTNLDGRYLTSYTETDPIFNAHTVSSIVNGTGLLKNDGAGNWSYDNNTYLTSFTETNDLTTSVTWADVPDANITQSSVTQHQAALSITESQISDLQNYLLAGDNVSLLTNDAGYITSADVVSSQWDDVTGGINYAGGNVGIGTTSPSEKLDVDGVSKINGVKVGEINGAERHISSHSDAGSLVLNGGTKSDSSANKIRIMGSAFNAGGGGIQFTTNNTERVFISLSGDVGIGTASPSAKLDVDGNVSIGTETSAYIDLERSTANYIRANNSDTGRLHITAGTDIRLHTGQADGDFAQNERMRIDSSGNVGIGITSPSEKLDVDGNVASDAFVTNGGTSSQYVMGDGSLKDYADPTVVWTSAVGDNTTQGADTWYKVATYNITSNFSGGTWAYNFNVSNVGSVSIAEVAIHLRRNASVSAYNVDIDCKSLTHLNGTAFLEKDSFLIVSNDASDIELWVKKKQNFGVVNATLISERQNETTVTYEPDTNSWTSITPSGTGDTQQSAAFRYINNGGAGTVDASTVMIVGDSTTSAGLSILGSTSGYSKLNFSDTGNEYAGQIEYDHKTNIMTFKTDGTARFSIRENGGVEVKKESYADSELNNGNSSTAITVDWTSKNYQNVTLTDTCVFTFTPPSGVTTLILKLTQDATGSRTVTFPASVLWSGGTAPTLTTDANAVDLISFYYDGTNYIGGFLSDVK